MIKGIIFDMDGVIVDNFKSHVEAFIETGRRYGVEVPREEIMKTFGMGNDEIFPRLLPAALIEKVGLEKLSEEKEELYRDIVSRTMEPVPGLVDFMKDVRSHGIKCAVGSSAPTANVDFVLDKLNIAQYFDAASDGDHVPHAKPDPAIFNYAAKLLDIPNEECLVFEDAFVGIEAASRAGMKAIALATTYKRADLEKTAAVMVIDDFTGIGYDTVASL